MDYLVSIEDIEYFQWQIALLIESFKLHNLQDSLVVIVASETSPKLNQCHPNLMQHERKFVVQNVRKINPYLNKVCAAVSATQKKLVNKQFTIIEPDMVMAKPLPKQSENITFSLDLIQNVDVKDCIKNHQLIPMGGIIQFNDVNPGFFEEVYTLGVKIEESRQNSKKCIKYAAAAAWTEGVYRNINEYSVRFANYESNLLSHEINNFVHYKHGMPPVFSKKMYNCDPKINLQLNGKSAIQSLVENSFSPAAHYVREIALKLN